MKATIDLSDGLLTAARNEAERRGITLDAIMEHALRQEILLCNKPGEDAPWEINEYGIPILKKTGNAEVTSEMIYRMMEEEGI